MSTKTLANTTPTPTEGGDLMCVTDLIARYPGTTENTWQRLRSRGEGPKFFKILRKVYYRRADVLTWEIREAKRNRTVA